MKFLPLFLLMITLCLSQTFSEVEGRRRSITEVDDLELERQLKIINKPANITIQTDMGDVYACVDIHQQPALDHPMLKNHKVQIRSTAFPKEFSDKEPSIEVYKKAILEKIDCPQGTVPIKRIGKEELRATKYFYESFQSRLKEVRPQTSKFPGLYRAVSKLSNGVYRGASAKISVEKLNVATDHFSTAHVWVSDDPDGFRNSLWAGSLVYPSMFNNSGATRLFVHWNNENTGCFNILCSGFVATSKRIPVPAVFNKVSDSRHKRVAEVTITQEDAGNWLLIVQNETIGYWPKGLIPALDDGASHLMWGGLTFGTPGQKSSPMGNGLLPDINNYGKSAFFAYMKIVDQTGALIEVPSGHRDFILDCPANYGAIESTSLGSSTLYGGPGGNC